MSVTATPYGQFLRGLGLGYYNFGLTDAVNVMLATSSYSPNVDTDALYATVSPYEVAGTNYTTGGSSLGAPLGWTYDSTNNWVLLTAPGNVTWAAATLTARYAVFYHQSPGTARLIGYVDFGADQSVVAQDFILDLTAGVLRLKVVAS